MNLSTTLPCIKILFLKYFMRKFENEGDHDYVDKALESVIYTEEYRFAIYILSIFSTIWHIIGAVTLFRDSMECLETDRPLWIIMLVCLILYWNSLIIGCYIECTHKKRADGYTEII